MRAFTGPDLGGFTSVRCTFRRSKGGKTVTGRLSLRNARRYVGMALPVCVDLPQDASIDTASPNSYKLLQGLTVSASDC